MIVINKNTNTKKIPRVSVRLLFLNKLLKNINFVILLDEF